jgi:transcriptional regulator with XRE-family HTH domain
VAKTFAEYATQRRQTLSAEGREALEVFNAAHLAGNLVRDARRARDITQRTLAGSTGIDQADISRIERGLTTPTLHTLFRLLNALGASVVVTLADRDPVRTRGRRGVETRTATAKRAAAAGNTVVRRSVSSTRLPSKKRSGDSSPAREEAVRAR